jgi:type II secretory pathway pseudopilin PulG
MIELLVVIAIIAILSAVVYPVASSVRIRAQENQVISNLKSIQASLQIYKQDEHGYPPTLGPVIYPGGELRTYPGMYPEWSRDRGAYHSPNNSLSDVSVTGAENGAEASYRVDLSASVSKGYVAPANPDNVADFVKANPAYVSDVRMYGWDTMDGNVSKNNSDDPDTWTYVLHYSRYRTWDVADPDYKRQLGYRNPPEDTVVTWNDTFVDWGDAGPDDDRGDLLVLFLDGTVRKYDVHSDTNRKLFGNVNYQFWRLKP